MSYEQHVRLYVEHCERLLMEPSSAWWWIGTAILLFIGAAIDIHCRCKS